MVVRPSPTTERAIGARPSPGSTCAAGRCWSTPAGTGTGAPTRTSRATRSSPGAAAEWLRRTPGAALVGIDSLNIDDIATGERPVHTMLLGAGIPIVEHLTGLAALPDGARFYAVPPPIEGMGTFPVRAFAVAE